MRRSHSQIMKPPRQLRQRILGCAAIGQQPLGAQQFFITKALTGESPTIDGDGEQTRDFTSVQNAVHANLLACTADAGYVSGEVFNLGCGERISVNRLWEAIQESTGAVVEPVNGPASEGDVRDSLASLDKIQTRMGYESTVSWAEGRRRTVEWLGGPAP